MNIGHANFSASSSGGAGNAVNDALHRTLQALSDHDRSALAKMLSQFKEAAGADAHDADHIGRLIKEVEAQTKASGPGADGQALDKTSPNLQVPGSGNPYENIMEVLLAVIKAAVQDGNEDLHQALEHMKHHADASRRLTTRLVLGSAGLIALGLLISAGLRFLRPPEKNPGPPDVGAGLVQHNPGPPDSNPGPPDAACDLRFVQPSPSAHIPDMGAVQFEWTSVPKAANYSLELQLPAGAGSPWVLPPKGTVKTLYMENFPAGGDYRASIKALGAGGEVLCVANFPFSKTAANVPADKPKEGNGGDSGGGPCISMAACP